MMHMDNLCVRLSNLMKKDIPSTSPIYTVAGEEEQEHSKIATSVGNLWGGGGGRIAQCHHEVLVQ